MINALNIETRRWEPLPTLLVTGTLILAGMTVNYALLRVWPAANKGQSFVMGGSFLLIMLLAIPIAAAYTGASGIPAQFALRLPPWRIALVGSTAFIVYVGCMDVFFRLIDREVGMETMRKVWLDCPPGSLWQVGFLVNVLVLAPLCEEVLFRGFLLEGLRTPFADRDEGRWLELHWGEWLAVVVSAGLWTALHGQYALPELVALMLMGVVLGAVRLRTKSLYVAIGLHFMNNLISMMHLATG